jgi:hypothetical protein
MGEFKKREYFKTLQNYLLGAASHFHAVMWKPAPQVQHSVAQAP